MPYSTFGNLIYGNRGRRLGGGIRGLMPTPTIDKINDSEFETIRVVVKEVWNNNFISTDVNGNVNLGNYACTPFRKVMNAGDTFSRVNYSCGGSCQTPQSIAGIASIKNSIGSIQNKCDLSQVPPSSCNVKYVYDSSDYTRFLKQNATVKNYNDLSFGGDQNNASFQAIQSMRSF